MTNSYPSGSPGAPDSGMPAGAPGFMPQRSSYASVVSGIAAGNSQQFGQPSRSSAFPIQYTSINQEHYPHYNDPDYAYAAGHHGYGGVTGFDEENSNGGVNQGRSGSRGGQLPSFSSAFGSLANGYGYGGIIGHADHFFVPSYLKRSKYVQNLEEAHKAKIRAHRDGSAPSSQPNSLSTSASSTNLHAKMVPSHRGRPYDLIEKSPLVEDETLPPLPSRWSSTDKYGALEIMSDGLEVKLTGPKSMNDRDLEACSIRSDNPMPPQCGIYYFEVTILSRKREDSSIGIGFSTKQVPLSRLPGWEPDSWAYHGDDGHAYGCSTSGKIYGPSFNTDDTIGCGINFSSGSAFFTQNGDCLGTAFHNINGKGKLFPSIGMKKPGEHIRVNFGQSPFVFDIDGMILVDPANVRPPINRFIGGAVRPQTAMAMETTRRVINTRRLKVRGIPIQTNGIDMTSVIPSDAEMHLTERVQSLRWLMREFLRPGQSLAGAARAMYSTVKPASPEDLDMTREREERQIKNEIASARYFKPSFVAYSNFDPLISTIKLAPPLSETELIQSLVLQFLTHDGYVDTARAFADEVHSEKKALNMDPDVTIRGFNIKEDEDAGHRQRIRKAILEGDIEQALNHTNAHYPQVLKDNEHVYFRLRCRKFIEMVRKMAEMHNNANSTNGSKKNATNNGDWYDDIINHNMEMDDHQPQANNWDRMETDCGIDSEAGYQHLLSETLLYGQILQAEFKDDPRKEISKALEDAFSLIAYKDPINEKTVSHILDLSGRVAVAEELNSAILLSLGKSSSAALEQVYQQTTVLLEDLRENGGPGAFVNIDDYIRPGRRDGGRGSR